jgi:hypothetical protein
VHPEACRISAPCKPSSPVAALRAAKWLTRVVAFAGVFVAACVSLLAISHEYQRRGQHVYISALHASSASSLSRGASPRLSRADLAGAEGELQQRLV